MEHLLVAFRGLSTVLFLWKTGAFCSMQEGEGGGAAEAESRGGMRIKVQDSGELADEVRGKVEHLEGN